MPTCQNLRRVADRVSKGNTVQRNMQIIFCSLRFFCVISSASSSSFSVAFLQSPPAGYTLLLNTFLALVRELFASRPEADSTLDGSGVSLFSNLLFHLSNQRINIDTYCKLSLTPWLYTVNTLLSRSWETQVQRPTVPRTKIFTSRLIIWYCCLKMGTVLPAAQIKQSSTAPQIAKFKR